MNRKTTLIIISALALSACVNQETFVKQNMRYTDFERDRAACETNAAQQVPVNRSPGAEIAVALITGIYQVNDANAPARIRNYESCMISKGYQRMELPPCKDMTDARANGVGPLTHNRRVQLTPKSCATNDTSGRIVFHQQS
ncbi:hypothetical protein LZG00_10510 [Rhodobacteraceae bacterium LMO-12]|nr:hypothetical protein [Rhodobacteraceae bacterium LMO-JJ12]